jgi:hypothetical protein
MHKSSSKFIYVGFLIAALVGGFGTYGIGNPTTQVLAQGGENMTAMSEMGGDMQGMNMTEMRKYVVRDSVAELLDGKTLPAGKFIHIYDTTPYMIMNGHVAVNVPCEGNSTASIQVLMGQAPNLTAADLENLPELSTPGEMCLYHVDISPTNEVITDVAIANPGSSDLEFPAGSTVVIGVNEIMPGAEEGEHGMNSTEEASIPTG